MKQSAVEFLHSEYKKIIGGTKVTFAQMLKITDVLEQAKEMEKQQQGYSEEDMLKSFMAGIKCESDNGKNFEQFIKQF